MKKYVYAEGFTLDDFVKDINMYSKKGYVIIPTVFRARDPNHELARTTWYVIMELQTSEETQEPKQ